MTKWDSHHIIFVCSILMWIPTLYLSAWGDGVLEDSTLLISLITFSNYTFQKVEEMGPMATQWLVLGYNFNHFMKISLCLVTSYFFYLVTIFPLTDFGFFFFNS